MPRRSLTLNASPVDIPAFSLATALRRLWDTNPALTAFVLLSIPVAVVAGVGIVVDPRIVTGVPAWVKPAKFAISALVYALTLVWLLSQVPGRRRWVMWIGNVTATVLLIEIPVIIVQAVRGIPSHFNATTPLNQALYASMGIGIAIVFLAAVATLILLARGEQSDPAFASSLRWGLVVTLAGMAVAFLMTMPTPSQRAALVAGEQVAAVGAHSVGVADGGPGLPFVGWSTTGGDLRVAHFIGLHGLQVLPLFGWVVARRRRWPTRHKQALVWVVGFGYLGVTGIATWQALRSQPLFQPDATTLGALGILLGAAALAMAVLARRASRTA